MAIIHSSMPRVAHFASVVDHRLNDIRINNNAEIPYIIEALQAIVQGPSSIPSRFALLGRVIRVRELYVHSHRYAKSPPERDLFRSLMQQRINAAIRRLGASFSGNGSLPSPLVAYITPHVELGTSRVYEPIRQGVQSISYRQASLELVRQNPFALEHLPEDFKRDRGIVRAAVRKNGMSLQFAHPDLRKEFAILRFALRSNGMAYQFIDPCWRRNFTLALEAVQSNGLAIQFLVYHLKSNPQIIVAALSNNGLAIRLLPQGCKENLSYALIAVQQNGLALGLFTESIRNNWEIGCAAIRQNPMAFYLAGDILRTNARFIAIAHHLMQDVPSSPAWAASPYDV